MLTESTLFLHGGDDQIVPIADSAMLAIKLVKNGTLKVYKGAPHGMCTTHKNQINEVLCCTSRKLWSPLPRRRITKKAN